MARLSEGALSDLIQDYQSTTGLAMTARVQLESGTMDDWLGWEPVFRALLDGRKAYETGDVHFTSLDGTPLDLNRTFSIDDDREEIAHFLHEAGFLHLSGVFDESEMAEVGQDIDDFIARAQPDDGDSWWAENAAGDAQAVRVLNFFEKSEVLRKLVEGDRYQWIGELTGDGHRHRRTAEGLVKPLGIVKGLSDLPWHKDCGQGRHSYVCNAMTCGISVTGADRVSGALGVVPGISPGKRESPGSRSPDGHGHPACWKPESATSPSTAATHFIGHIHPQIDRARLSIQDSGCRCARAIARTAEPRYNREARAELSNVEDRIAAAGQLTRAPERA